MLFKTKNCSVMYNYDNVGTPVESGPKFCHYNCSFAYFLYSLPSFNHLTPFEANLCFKGIVSLCTLEAEKIVWLP